jgi:hypothetical protein
MIHSNGTKMPYLTYETIEGRNSLKGAIAKTMQEEPSSNEENLESSQLAQGSGNEGLANETTPSRNPSKKNGARVSDA